MSEGALLEPLESVLCAPTLTVLDVQHIFSIGMAVCRQIDPVVIPPTVLFDGASRRLS
jgi:hypothetical protein